MRKVELFEVTGATITSRAGASGAWPARIESAVVWFEGR
jgi:hypothetical protein